MSFEVKLQGAVGEIQEVFDLCSTFELKHKSNKSEFWVIRSNKACSVKRESSTCDVSITDPYLLRDIIACGQNYALIRTPYTNEYQIVPVVEPLEAT